MRARKDTAGSPRSPWIARGAWLLAMVFVGTAGFAAGRATLTPPEADLGAGPPATAAAVSATVGRHLPLSVMAEWQRSPLGSTSGAGTLTSIEADDGDEVSVGDILYRADLRPVVIAEGTVPSFRTLSSASRGTDVAQLQRFLVHEKHLHEGAFTTGTFDAATRVAVRAWQKKLDVPVDGIVQAGDILYTPNLPVRVARATDVTVGSSLDGNSSVFEKMSTDPVLRASIPQDSNIRTETELELGIGEDWLTVVVTAVETDVNDPSRTYAVLGAPDDTVLCASGCDISTSVNGTVLPGRQIIVPEAEGPAVPIAAIHTDAAGTTYVLDADGTRIDVTVEAHGDGRAVISGLDVGTTVQLPEAPTT